MVTPKRPGPKKRPGPPKGSVGRRKAPEARHDPYRRYPGEPGYRAPSGTRGRRGRAAPPVASREPHRGPPLTPAELAVFGESRAELGLPETVKPRAGLTLPRALRELRIIAGLKVRP
jgi:hypothetical protein